MRFIDLFCGIGGFRQALEESGSTCVFSSDWDKDAQFTYLQNYDEGPSGDLTEVKATEVPDHEVICGGFPCQPFSISGNQGGFEDARGTLLHEILRMARHHRPSVLFLENVKNYLGHDNGRTLSMTVRLLEKAGYSVFHQVLNASRFGVAQKRERLYFVCLHRDLGVDDFLFPEPTDEEVALEDFLLPANDSRLDDLVIERSDLRLSSELPGQRENRPLRIGSVGKGGQGERVYSPKGHAITLSAYGGGIGAKTGMYLIEDRVRRLHPEECRRIMGFAEGFLLHPRRNVCYRQFGNSVAVPVVRKIFQSIVRALGSTTLRAA